MTEIDLHAITRRLEIIKAESSQGGLADVPGLVDEVRWHRAAMTEIGEWLEQLGVYYVPIAESCSLRASLWNHWRRSDE